MLQSSASLLYEKCVFCVLEKWKSWFGGGGGECEAEDGGSGEDTPSGGGQAEAADQHTHW